MKKILLIICALVLSVNLQAQSPAKMSYQTVIRNASGALVSNQAVGLRMSILHNSATGTALYTETQTANTNANGLASLSIGSGSVVSGDLNTIDWNDGTYFLKTEIDPTGGTSYSISGSSQLLSVPYALHAKTSADNKWRMSGTNIINTNSGYVGVGTATPNAPLAVATTSGKWDNAIEVLPSTDTTSNRASIRLGDWLILQDINGGGRKDFSIYQFGNANTQRIFIDTSGNVGIGNNTPGAKLAVGGNVKIVDGTQGAGKVLTSDADGLASWAPATQKAYLGASHYGQTAIFIADNTPVNFYCGNLLYNSNMTYSNTGLTVPYAGVYHFSLIVSFPYIYGNAYQVEIRTYINNGLYSQNFTDNFNIDINLNANDVVTFSIIQHSGATRELGAFSKFSCFKVN